MKFIFFQYPRMPNYDQYIWATSTDTYDQMSTTYSSLSPELVQFSTAQTGCRSHFAINTHKSFDLNTPFRQARMHFPITTDSAMCTFNTINNESSPAIKRLRQYRIDDITSISWLHVSQLDVSETLNNEITDRC